MKVYCAWCQKEGKPEAEAVIGEKEPLDDPTHTHGICPHHRREVEDRVTRLREDIRQQAERQQAEAERQREEVEELRQRVDP